MRVQSQVWEDTLEKEMATHSSILALKIPWTEEFGQLQSMESQSQTRLSKHKHPQKMEAPSFYLIKTET